ncbi:MAG: AAA family ATPase, partial [Bacteroidia bacterium]|nr:AAA family ATPase [Bacteroidia bacterium]
ELNDKQKAVLAFCTTPKSATEILEHIGLSVHSKNKHTYITMLISAGLLSMTIPETPNDRRQKYLTVKK